MTLTDAHITRPGATEPSERPVRRRDQPAVLRQRCLDCARAGRGPTRVGPHAAQPSTAWPSAAAK